MAVQETDGTIATAASVDLYSPVYLWVAEGPGTKITVNRIWKDSQYNTGGSTGVLKNYIEETDEYGILWKGYKVWHRDSFTIDAQALPGYALDRYDIQGYKVDYAVIYLAHDGSYDGYTDYTDGNAWYVDLNRYNSESYIYATANGWSLVKTGWEIVDSYNANEPPRPEGTSTDGSGYVLVRQAEGTKLTVYRCHVDNSSFYDQGDYVGELVNGQLFKDNYGTWYRYKAWNDDYFYIEAEALPGYIIDTHNINDYTCNFYVSGMDGYEEGTVWNFDGNDISSIARIYTTAKKDSKSWKDYGSGSGILYFDIDRSSIVGLKDRYEVEFSYSDNKFYINSVKLASSRGIASTFDLLIKINDVVIYSGQKYIDGNYDFFDLNISGCVDITDEVTVTFLGTVQHSSSEVHSVISHTAKTIAIDYSNTSGLYIDNGSNFGAYDCYIYSKYVSGYLGYTSSECDIIGSKGYYCYDNGTIDGFDDDYMSNMLSYWGYGGSASAIYMLKFITPNFIESSNGISINICTWDKTSTASDTNTLMNYAICTSDVNYDLYATTTGVPNDEYIIAHGTFNEVVNGTSVIVNNNVTLLPNTNYYLFVWDTNKNGETTLIDSTPNHSITVTHVDTTSEPIYSYKYMPYDIYIDNGTSWEKL